MQLLPRPQRDFPLLKGLKPGSQPEKPWGNFLEQEQTQPTTDSSHQPHQNLRSQKLSERVAIFIDGANLFNAALQLNLEIDYGRLLRCLTKNRPLLRAYFYTGVNHTNNRQYGFLLWMRRNGYRVFTKKFSPGENGAKTANLDVEMTVDMLTLAPHCNNLVLISGSENLTYALNRISYLGVRTEVVSLRSMTSDDLINVADEYIDLELLKTGIQKKYS